MTLPPTAGKSLIISRPVIETPMAGTASTRDERFGRRILSRAGGNNSYTMRLARNAEEVRAVQALRFMVFNLELQEGLEASYLTLRDEDEFDPVCEHLLVECDGQVVGTYRMQTGTAARNGRGFYSGQEFAMAPFEPVMAEVVELGRACVDARHRNLQVLTLLWRGIAQYARLHRCRYLLGCSSLNSVDPAEGALMYAQLAGAHLAERRFQTGPLPGFSCVGASPTDEEPRRVKVPRLLNAYLSLGAKICGPPALDRQFKTIDFLTLLDLDSLPQQSAAFLD